MGYTLKGKNLLLEQNLFLKSMTLFGRALSSKVANRKSRKLLSFVKKMVKKDGNSLVLKTLECVIFDIIHIPSI